MGKQLKSTVDIIKSYSTFKSGWDFGSGDVFRPEVINKAIEITELGEVFGFETEAFPEVTGAITVSYSNGSYCLDVSVNADMTFDIQYEQGIGESYQVLTQIDSIQEAELDKWFRKLQSKF